MYWQDEAFFKVLKHLRDQGTSKESRTLVPKGVPWNPPKKTTSFLPKFFKQNMYHICMHYKKS